MRRLLILASTMVFFDVAFYAAIAPLLPDYVARFDLSKAQAGVLAASYAAGTLLSSLPAGLLATRIGPRRTAIAGLLLLGLASLVFGFGGSIGVLDAARFAQGISGALIWAGSLTWLIASADPERRGAAIGTALGTAIAGALIGPLLGAVAAAAGTKLVFGAVLGVALLLATLAARQPESVLPGRQPLRDVAATLLSRPLLSAAAFVAVPSLMFGAVEVLVPLRIAELGGGHALIAAGFIVGAALEGALAPIAGRYSDRAGRRAPFVAGIGICAGAMLGIGFAQALGSVLLALILGSLGAGICFAPAMTMLSEAAESSSLHQGFAAGLSNMAWSSGQVAGALAGGALAGAAGYAAPSLAVAALLVLTAVYAHRFLTLPAMRLPRPRPALAQSAAGPAARR
ncbi:MAG TPA: MFS transporter [Solirubrobacterales bacterium]|nr:MFS transporter [Solirubrobacterales bacterium]